MYSAQLSWRCFVSISLLKIKPMRLINAYNKILKLVVFREILSFYFAVFDKRISPTEQQHRLKLLLIKFERNVVQTNVRKNNKVKGERTCRLHKQTHYCMRTLHSSFYSIEGSYKYKRNHQLKSKRRQATSSTFIFSVCLQISHTYSTYGHWKLGGANLLQAFKSTLISMGR